MMVGKDFDFKKIKMKEIPNSYAKNFIKKHHYTRTCPKATISLGFYYEGELCTVIVYGQPSNYNLAKSIWEGGNEKECMELLRLFSFDWCPKNIESYCIAQSIKFLKKNYPEIKVLISYADASVGHVGYIYQATNWLYAGLSSSEYEIYVDGVKMHRRSLYDKYGTSSIKSLKDILGDRIEIGKKNRKHKYIYVLGNSKKEHKELMKKMKIKITGEYPKEKLNYYNNSENCNLCDFL